MAEVETQKPSVSSIILLYMVDKIDVFIVLL